MFILLCNECTKLLLWDNIGILYTFVSLVYSVECDIEITQFWLKDLQFVLCRWVR